MKANLGADPMEALKSAMVIGALPFAMVMLSLTKALFRDSAGSKDGDGSSASAE